MYLNFKMNTAIIWDNAYRKKHNGIAHCFSQEKQWDRDKVSMGSIYVGNRCFKSKDSLSYEKVLIMNFDTLYENIYYLYDLLPWDESDDNIPKKIKNELSQKKVRGRHTVEQWNRECAFRHAVLDAYNNQCAICHCKEKKLLQAAHIVPVAKGGSDSVSNGICLCANHHLMFDSGLIKIDFKKLKLTYIAESVKIMPWYKEFQEKYDEKIMPRKG